MNKKIIVSAMMTILLTAGSTAFADNDRHDRGRNSHGQHDDRGRGHDHDRYDHGKKDKHAYRHDNGHHNGRGAGPHHNFYKGGYIPREYRHNQYVVNDWRGRHLHQPPHGYHWVRTGPDYVLIAISTGIIAQIVLSN